MTTIPINYQKRKNTELFETFKSSKSLFLSETQNYNPIYKRFFDLNETNYNNINLNHKWFISNIKENENENIFNCEIKNINNNKVKDQKVFFKMAPLLDPLKYLIGKYDISDNNLFKLPNNKNETDINIKIKDENNLAYVDSFFVYLNSILLNNYNFIHGINFYGSFSAIKNDFKFNIFDDLEYLTNSNFFNKNKNVLFKIDDYSHLIEDENIKLKPIKIEYNSSEKSNCSIKSFDDDMFENIFEKEIIDLNNLKEMSIDLVDITNVSLKIENKTTTINSGSSCSSRTSHTSENEEEKEEKEENEEKEEKEETKENDWETESEESSYIEEKIEATITKFPVQVICMENCETTFDDLILNNELTNEEWFSALMQIIMILITFQKTFSLTHNDLHTNNVMYNTTTKKYIYYLYNKKYYKVPTFGRLFKIIDFGRSIYKFNNKIFCSDSFQNNGDASTQYNTEPYFNDLKPRLEPNFSFDICRLACSIYDYVIDDLSEVDNIKTCDSLKRLIYEWCLDDKGINLLYKKDGSDRYPEFKLYKMIARCVHNHTPQLQLERSEFKEFSNFKGEIPKNEVIDIDKIPIL
jgi:hypothetical protein